MPGKSLILVHGRGFKPVPGDLWPLWQQAISAGLARDFEPEGGSGLLSQAHVDHVYYGDLCNDVLERAGQTEDADLDLADRRQALKRLIALDSAKKFRRLHYEALPGKTSVKEFLADVGAPLLAGLGLTSLVLRRVMPEMAEYLQRESDFRRISQQRLLDTLLSALSRGDEVLLLTHCLGSVIAYDVLWRMTHEPAIAAQSGGHRVHTWITLGSPLADEFVKGRLEGAKESAERRHPRTLVNWYNIAAEDDYICHDETMANDYGAMLNHRQISEIRDLRIYNLTIRYGRSSPHSAIGYLIHPRTIGLIASWLRES
jgi:hypothetical protein